MQRSSEILERYVPDWWDSTPRDYIENELLTDSHIERGQLYASDETVYVADDTITHTGVAIHDVIATIEWRDIPVEHPALKPPSSQYDDETRERVRWYTRIRGTIAHAALLEVSRDPRTTIADALDRLRGPPGDATYEDVLNTLAELDVAPTIRDGTIHVYDSAEEALKEKARNEGRSAATNWMLQEDELPHTLMKDEVMYVVETEQRTWVGGQADRIAHLHDYDKPAAIEVKVAENIHPSHILQAETARRGVSEILDDEVVGVVLRITPEGEYEILTSNDDEWPTEIVWDSVCRRSKRVYERLEPHLKTAERRLL